LGILYGGYTKNVDANIDLHRSGCLAVFSCSTTPFVESKPGSVVSVVVRRKERKNMRRWQWSEIIMILKEGDIITRSNW
jgi:predicted GIY-YIG superfamily endonuclease